MRVMMMPWLGEGVFMCFFFPPFLAKVSKHDLQVVFFLSAGFPELVPVLNGEQVKQHEKTMLLVTSCALR